MKRLNINISNILPTRKAWLGVGLLLALASCTDLNEQLYDKVSQDDYGKTSSEVATIVGGAYATLRGYGSGTPEGAGIICYPTCEYVFFTQECSSDEACIPTRGTDWYDGGRYQQFQRHNWDAKNSGILSVWRYNFTGVSKVNAIIYQVEQSGLTTEDKQKVEAELRGLRAYYYYNYGRFTQNVANTLLARLYLNAEVFTGTARWQDCLDACNKVQGYSLTPNYKASFAIQNEKSPEIIFSIPYDHKQGTVGNYLASMTYHYNQKLAFDPAGVYQWCGNGICAQPGLYSSFDARDVRRQSLLIGQQYSAKDGSEVLMDDGSPLNYTEEIDNFTDAAKNAGARLNKYEWSANDSWERDNDWVLMRYAEILMMQAECNFRLGYTPTALTYINQIRKRAGLDDLTTLTLDDLDNEWKHEFVFENLRRTTNIRFGTYFKPWWEKPADPADKHTGIYPIPQEELSKNPNLKQNPGYEN